ncbi:1-deoxy-D-xylulose-5-phosphate synthase N-terminal domain-containing protein [Stackebrandtia soli]|uniref:1-deoxy-D-xylulose-5-phosphate synthase N-terminal domain-containing protein n=1 Tax=Stackebrandtia soli TaxID=1892856 RepID=UPI0039EBB0C9
MTALTTGLAEARRLAQRTVVDPRYPISTYTLDVLWVLYDRVLSVSPERVDDPERDRFLLSKGHLPGAYYALLAARGFIPSEWLDSVAATDSPLGAHPDRTRVPGVEISSGSLGHGLPIGVGMALGLRAQGLTVPRVYVLIGDGELDEGSNHEAMEYAGATGLDSLTVVVSDNGSATHGRPGGIASRFTAAGWSAVTAPASDHVRLEAAFTDRPGDRPHVVVATS